MTVFEIAALRIQGRKKIKLSQIVKDKHSSYQPGDRAIWKSGIYEKTHHGWKKVGTSHPMKVIGKGGVQYDFYINKKNFAENKKKLQKRIIADIKSGNFTSKTGLEAKEKAKKWFNQNFGSTLKTEIGTVIIDDNCFDNSFGHGKYPAKYDTVQAIKPILTNGVYLGEMDDLDGNDIDNHYFAGKIKLDGKEKFVFCRIRESVRSKGGKRFYLHSVYTEDDIKKGALNKAAPTYKKQDNSGAPLELSLIQNFLNCK